MDSWSYVCEGKGFVSDETGSPPELLSQSKNVFMGWELKPQSGFGNTLLVPAHQGIEIDGLMKVPEMIRKQYPKHDSSWGVFGSKFSSGRVDSFDAFSGEEESNSKLSSSVVESNGRDSSFIDLKLGRFGDNRDVHSSKPSKVTPIMYSSQSYMPMKKARMTGLNLQTTFCIVHGCNKDLSGSKDYHKRHKVCEVHSKTAKVIVNGIEQRFCQQCSRFHLLVEFDDGKRSCRKRLAGHNERRRKTHVGIHSSRSGRPFPTYNGNKFQESSVTTSFVCQDILPSGLLHPENYENNSCCRPVKLEDEVEYTQTISNMNSHFHHKSLYTPYSFEKQFHHPLHENGVNGNVFENGIRYPHDLVSGNSLPCSLFQNTDFGVFATASTGQGLSRISDSGCALSLLSSQSLNSPRHSSGVPMARHGLYNTTHMSDKLFGVISQASTSGVSNNNFSGEGNLLDPIMISDGVNFDVRGDGVYHGSDVVNSKDCLSCDNGPTIDLLQLSSQLQRVERHRQSMQIKPENDAFCCLRIT